MRGSTLRVLIVESDQDEAIKLFDLMTSLGYQAKSATGNDLLEALRSFQPDVILADRQHSDITEDKHGIIIDAKEHVLLSGILERTLATQKSDDLLFAEAEMYQRDEGRNFTDNDIERLTLIRKAFAKYDYFGGSSIVGRFIRDLPETINLSSMNPATTEPRLQGSRPPVSGVK